MGAPVKLMLANLYTPCCTLHAALETVQLLGRLPIGRALTTQWATRLHYLLARILSKRAVVMQAGVVPTRGYAIRSLCRAPSKLAAPKAAVPPARQPTATRAWAATKGVLESGTRYTKRGPAMYTAAAIR